MTHSTLLIWIFLLPAIAALAEYALGRRFPAAAGKASVLGSTATFAAAILLVVRLGAGAPLVALGHQLRADAFSGYVALIVAFVGWVTTVFAYPYLRHEAAAGKIAAARLPLYFVWSMVFLSTMTAVTVNNNIIMMYVLVEATTLASALLVTFYWKPESLEAGYKYLLLCSVGITIGLLGCVIIYAAAVPLLGGANAMLISEIVGIAGQLPPLVVLMAGVFIIIGFGSKAGFVPFHAWLPDAHSQSPSPVSALLSGVTIKVAVYAIARMATVFFPGHGALGTFAIVLDLKRMLAYSSLEHIGIIALGAGIGGAGAFAAMYHLVSHSIAKSMAFLSAGRLIDISGTNDMRRIRGSLRSSPVWGAGLLISLLVLVGTAPFAIFFTEFLTLRAAFDAGAYAVGAAFLAGVSIVFIGVLRKAIPMAWGTPGRAGPASRTGFTDMILVALPLLCLLTLGLWMPPFLREALHSAAAVLGAAR